jgi:uncharacterized protein (DUF305 family)
MILLSNSAIRLLTAASMGVILTSLATASFAQTAPIFQPGAPGETARKLSAEEASNIARMSYSHDDVLFMQNMIPHHAQAIEMATLVAERTNRKELLDVAGRIDASQADEIKFMQNWLSERGEAIMPQEHGVKLEMDKMSGMATPEQLAELKSLKSSGFDKLFLELMIAHHEGAVEMVKTLLEQPGSAYDPILFEFTDDVTNDQNAEIERMSAVLVSFSTDKRANLKPGFDDAGQAIMNLKLVASLSKPPGFFDPKNPSELQPLIPEKETDKQDGTTPKDAPKDAAEEDDKPKRSKRSALLSFSNTDMAFSGDTLVTGSYHGFNIYKLQKEGAPKLLSSVVCPGGQGDVSIVDDLLIMSVEQTRGRIDCGLEGINEDVSEDRFRGLRIFNISNLDQPVQVGQVQTCRGSHTHSVVSNTNGKIIVYNSGTSSVREEEELEGCFDGTPGDDRTALFRIDVIEIPIDDPAKSRIVDSPAVFADPKTGRLAGLWKGGDHGDDTQRTNITNQCHDITVFPAAKIAAGACSGNGIIFDISNPLKPTRIDEVVDKGFAYWHSATFNNDGTKVIFTDEWGGGGRARCRAHDPKDWGADAIYDIVDGQLEFKGHYKLPAPQSKTENCVAHNGSVIPVPGRDIFAQAWYQGGVSVMDFTDSSNPVEIAYFDRGPIHEDELVVGGYWSSYWYDGKIYGTEIARGLDVFSLLPSEFLSENEIAAALLADQGGTFNPQQQFPVSWPAKPIIALAYLDQLQRSEALPAATISNLKQMLNSASTELNSGRSDPSLVKQFKSAIKELNNNVVSKDEITNRRIDELTKTLKGIAKGLQ